MSHHLISQSPVLSLEHTEPTRTKAVAQPMNQVYIPAAAKETLLKSINHCNHLQYLMVK